MLAQTKSEYDVGRASPAPSKILAYDRYLAQGPAGRSDIEMTRLNTDQVPLLTAQQEPGFFSPMASRSNTTLASYAPPYSSPMLAESAPQLPAFPAMPPMQDYREAPLHRPYPSYPSSPQPPPQPQPQQAYPPAPSPAPNMAGRGAHRGF